MTAARRRVLPGGGPTIAYDVAGHENSRPVVFLHSLMLRALPYLGAVIGGRRGE